MYGVIWEDDLAFFRFLQQSGIKKCVNIAMHRFYVSMCSTGCFTNCHMPSTRHDF